MSQQNMQTIQEELARKYVGRQYLEIGTSTEETLIYDLASSLVGRIPKETFHALVAAGRVLNSAEMADSLAISQTRLEKVMKGDYDKTGVMYIFHRYVDNANTTVAYLVLIIDQNSALMRRYSADKVLGLAKNGVTMLNAKLTKINGKETIQGISGELLVEKTDTIVTKPQQPKVEEVQQAPEPKVEQPQMTKDTVSDTVANNKNKKYLDKLLTLWYKRLREAGHIHYGQGYFTNGRGSRLKDFAIVAHEFLQPIEPRYAEVIMNMVRVIELEQENNPMPRTADRRKGSQKGLILYRVMELMLWQLVATHHDKVVKYLTKDVKQNRHARRAYTVFTYDNSTGKGNESLLYAYPEESVMANTLAGNGLQDLLFALECILDYRNWLLNVGIGFYKGHLNDSAVAHVINHYVRNFKVPNDMITRHRYNQRKMEMGEDIGKARTRKIYDLEKEVPVLFQYNKPFQYLNYTTAETFSYFGIAKRAEHADSETFSPFYGNIKLRRLGSMLGSQSILKQYARVIKENDTYALGAVLLIDYIKTQWKQLVGKGSTKPRTAEIMSKRIYRSLMMLGVIDEQLMVSVYREMYENGAEQPYKSLDELQADVAKLLEHTQESILQGELQFMLQTGCKIGYYGANAYSSRSSGYETGIYRNKLISFSGKGHMVDLSSATAEFGENFNKVFPDLAYSRRKTHDGAVYYNLFSFR